MDRMLLALHLMRLAVLLELLTFLALFGLCVVTKSPPNWIFWILLDGPLLWLYANALCLSTPSGKLWIPLVLLSGGGAILTVLWLLAGPHPDSWVWLLLPLLLAFSIACSLLYCHSIIMLFNLRGLSLPNGILLLIPTVGTLAGFVFPLAGILLFFAYIFWLVFYSVVLHRMAIALEEAARTKDDPDL